MADFFRVVALLALLVAAACSKKSDTSMPTATVLSSLQVVVAGEADFTVTDTDVLASRLASTDPNEAPYRLLGQANLGSRYLMTAGQSETGHAFYGERPALRHCQPDPDRHGRRAVGGDRLRCAGPPPPGHLPLHGQQRQRRPTEQLSNGRFAVYNVPGF